MLYDIYAIAEGNASALFARKGVEGGHLAQSALVIEYDGRGQRVPEAQRIHVQLDSL